MTRTLRLRAATAAAAILATVASLLLLVPATPAGAAPTLPAGFTQDVIATGLDLPTAMAVLPDGRVLVTEKSGVIRVIKDGVLLPTPFADLRGQVNDYWDRGLTGIAVAPDFATSRHIFLFYPHDSTGTDGSDPVTNRLTRITADGDVMVPGSEVVVLGSVTGAGCPTTSPDCIPQDWYGHSADSLRFAPDGSLFVTMGDAASWDYVDDRALRAQDIDQYPGKVLRITRDGDGLASNPFYNGDPDAIRSKVWAYGLRNPFRTSLQPGTNQLFVGDVGWSSFEELDVATAGANFGWPCYEGNGRQPGYEPKAACQALYAQGPGAVKAPAYTYSNVGGASIVGGPFTPATSTFPEAYQDGFFFGDYAKSTIKFARANASGQITEGPFDFASSLDGPVDLQFDLDGNLLYLAINAGELRRIRPGGGTDPTGPDQWLSDLAPALTQNGWGPYERDLSNGEQAAGDGRTLSIGGKTYAKGLGVHAASEIRYTVPAGCLFTAEVGIDDEVGDRGSVQFEVWDGTNARLYQSPVKRGTDGATAVSVPLNGVTDLRLLVVGTTDGVAFDHADWGAARIECDPDVVGTPPTPVIEAPASNSTFAVGEVIQLRGSATDPEDGPLPSSALSWRVIIQHCGVTGGDCHVHTMTTATGATASFVGPDHSDESYIEVVLTATDSDGNVTTISKNVQPRTVEVSFATSPAGLQVLYGDRPLTTPVTVNALVGGTRTITAPSPQGSSTFSSWSDGGARQHEITVPSAPATYTATFSGGTGGPTTTFLSDLTPVGSPVNGWGPYERDRANGEDQAGDGPPLTINGTTYAKGLGTHAAADLRYAVPSGCTTFTAQVGVDDAVANRGTVVFEVWNGTATRLYQSPLKTGNDAATAVSVPLSGVSTLRLVVTAHTDGKSSDHADWGDAKLTCSGGTTPPPDTTAPTISSVNAAPTSTGATITWTTDEASDTRVEYGSTASYGSATTLAPAMVTSHSQTLSGLTPSTTYHYRVRSADAAGNVALSTDRTFTTPAASGGGSATFAAATTQATGTHAHSVTPFNVDGDGRLDLAVANAGSDTVSVLVSNGSGGFAPPLNLAVGDQPKSVAAGDLDGDGDIDLVSANQGTHDISVLRNTGTTAFGPTFAAATAFAVCTGAHEPALGDLNGDGKLDVAVACWGGSVVTVLLGNGDGTFGARRDLATGSAPHSVVILETNADGKLDLAVANNGSGNVSILRGNGDGTFQAATNIASGSGPHSIRNADLNGDGRQDLAVANQGSNTVTVLLGTSAGGFAPAVGYATAPTPKGVTIADVDGDGKLDLGVATINGNYPNLVNPGGNDISILLGNGDGTFKPRTDVRVGQAPFAVAFVRLDTDAKPDLVAANWHDGGITIRRNTSP